MNRPPLIRLYEFDGEVDIDGFAGGGGTSTGFEMATGRSPSIAINHDPIALAMHEANHPETRHIVSNIRHVRYEDEVPADKRVGVAWFSPDCTFHSKARGGKPYRDPLKARRIRGLAWEAVRCVKALGPRAPRIIILENVEEWRDWCPLLKNGTPDRTRLGENYRRWKRELAKSGIAAVGRPYVIEDRELVACDYGSPTKRKRLFVIARCDGQPIVWPEPTHGPGRLPYRTAAECLDFSLPVPSIFMTQRQAHAWAKKIGLPKGSSPRRPLAHATKRRIARGVQRFVLDCPEPFIVNNLTNNVPRPVSEPLATTLTGNHKFLVQPALVTPFLAQYHHPTSDGGERGQALDAPIATLDTSNRFALIAPTLINTRNGERKGQAPRIHDIREPFNTITAVGSQGALVAAFLAKHNAGHEATGQKLATPIDTVTTKDSKALVTSHLVKLRGGLKDHPNTAQDLREPLPTQTAGGTHYAEVRITLVPRESIDASYVDRAVQTCAFLVKYFGTGVARPIDQPLGTLTTKDRIGLVQVVLMKAGDQEWVLADIGMRMLTPRELFLCQGFPQGYEIDHVPSGPALDLFGTKGKQKLTKKAQTRLVGNSVPPHVAAAIITANLAQPEQEAVA